MDNDNSSDSTDRTLHDLEATAEVNEKRPASATPTAGPVLEKRRSKFAPETTGGPLIGRRRTAKDLEAGSALSKQVSQREREQAESDEARQFGTKERDNKDPFLVAWDGEDDPLDPLNWNENYRWFLTFVSGLLILNASFASSATAGIAEECAILDAEAVLNLSWQPDGALPLREGGRYPHDLPLHRRLLYRWVLAALSCHKLILPEAPSSGDPSANASAAGRCCWCPSRPISSSRLDALSLQIPPPSSSSASLAAPSLLRRSRYLEVLSVTCRAS
jgi:hypothetical protein